MTREEAKRILYVFRAVILVDASHIEAFDMAMKALEQEPCEDAISRQAVVDWLTERTEKYDEKGHFISKELVKAEVENWLAELPSVTPQPKTGRWIMKHRIHNEVNHYTGQDEFGETHTISVLTRYEADEPYCSECGKRAGDTSQNYCCACGVKMRGDHL